MNWGATRAFRGSVDAFGYDDDNDRDDSYAYARRCDMRMWRYRRCRSLIRHCDDREPYYGKRSVIHMLYLLDLISCNATVWAIYMQFVRFKILLANQFLSYCSDSAGGQWISNQFEWNKCHCKNDELVVRGLQNKFKCRICLLLFRTYFLFRITNWTVVILLYNGLAVEIAAWMRLLGDFYRVHFTVGWPRLLFMKYFLSRSVARSISIPS